MDDQAGKGAQVEVVMVEAEAAMGVDAEATEVEVGGVELHPVDHPYVAIIRRELEPICSIQATSSESLKTDKTSCNDSSRITQL